MDNLDVGMLFSKSHNTGAREHSVKLVDHLKSDKNVLIYSAYSELLELAARGGWESRQCQQAS